MVATHCHVEEPTPPNVGRPLSLGAPHRCYGQPCMPRAATTVMVLAALVLGGLRLDLAPAAAASPPNPPGNIPIGQLPASCPQAPLSVTCEDAIVGYLDSARSDMGLTPYQLPPSFFSLLPEKQVLVLSDLDRLAYGLPPVLGLNGALDTAASIGVQDNADPRAPKALLPGGPVLGWGSNWAGGFLNALAAYYAWVYDDGYGSANGDCTSPGAPGCWGHRQNVLISFGPPSKGFISMGAAAGSYPGDPSYAMLIADSSELPSYSYTWATAISEGAGGEEGPAREEGPGVVTDAATSLTQSAVVLNGTVNPDGRPVETCLFEYGTSTSYGSVAACAHLPGSGATPLPVSASITGLRTNTTYHFRIVASNAAATSRGADQTFTTQSPSHEEANLPMTIVEPPAAPGQHPASANASDSTPPVHLAALASRSLTATASGAVKVKLSCLAADARCTGTVTLRTLTAVLTGTGHHRRRSRAIILTLARGSFTAARYRTTTVTLHLSAKARSLLAGSRVLRARATVAAYEPRGITRITKAIVTIRVAPPQRAS